MAVSLSIQELQDALRVDSTEDTAQVTRLHGYVSIAVVKYAPNAPDIVHNEAATRLAGFLFDRPYVAGEALSNSMRYSGASSILQPYREHRAGTTGTVTAGEDAIVTPEGSGLSEAQVQTLINTSIQSHAGISAAHHTPPVIQDLGVFDFTTSTSVTTFHDTGLRIPDKNWLFVSRGSTQGGGQTYPPSQWPRVSIADLRLEVVDAGSPGTADPNDQLSYSLGIFANGNLGIKLDGFDTNTYTGSIRFMVT